MEFKLPVEQEFELSIFDLTGRMILHQEGIGLEGENTLSIRLEGYAAGVYLLDFRSDAIKTQKRLILQY